MYWRSKELNKVSFGSYSFVFDLEFCLLIKKWISNLGLLVDERADVAEVPLLDGQHVGSEAELYF